MKKALILVIAITLLVSVNIVIAKVGQNNRPNGRPFQDIWNAIKLDSTSQCSSECPEGPVGPQGPQGIQGEPGESNWDEERIAALEARECLPESVKEVDTGLLGICSTGTQTCNEDWLWEDIVPDDEPVDEICDDQLDNDCDGEVDEDCGA